MRELLIVLGILFAGLLAVVFGLPRVTQRRHRAEVFDCRVMTHAVRIRDCLVEKCGWHPSDAYSAEIAAGAAE